MDGIITHIERNSQEIQLATNEQCTPGEKLNIQTEKTFMKGLVRWVAGPSVPNGQIVKREMNDLGQIVETILGDGTIQDHFICDTPYQYLNWCKDLCTFTLKLKKI